MKETTGTREGDPEGHRVSRGEKIAMYIPSVMLLLIMFIAIAVVIQQANYASTSRQFSYDIRQSQFEQCIKSANEFTKQVRDEFVGLKEDILLPVFERIHLLTPPDNPTYDILGDAIDVMHHRIKTIEDRIPNAHCTNTYPPLEGQTYEVD